MENTNLFRAIVRSIYSMQLYEEVASRWSLLRAIGYMTLVAVLFFGIILIIQSYRLLYQPLAVLEQMANQFPMITFKNQVASADQTSPAIISFAKSDTPFIVVDTKDQIIDVLATPGNIFIQSRGVILKGDEILRAYPYSDMIKGVYGPKEIKHTLKLVGESVFPLAIFTLWILYIVSFFITSIIWAFIVGIIGRIYAFFAKRSLHYRWVVRMALLAASPALILTALLSFVHISFLLHRGMVSYLIFVLVYVLFAIYKMPKKEETAS